MSDVSDVNEVVGVPGTDAVVELGPPVPSGRVDELVSVLHEAEEDDDLLRAALGDPANHCYAAVVGGRVVGAVVVRWQRGLSSEILYIGVDAAARGRGAGRALLDHVAALLPSYGRRLVVGTASSSLDNLAFYQRCGFRMSGVRRDHFSYVEPGTEEFGIPLRDMVVFELEVPGGPAAPVPAPSPSERRSLDDVRFLLVPGSTRSASGNQAVLRTVDRLLPRSEVFGRLESLPQFNPDRVDEPPPEVLALRASLARADVVVFCTPEYAGSLPGSLKNLLDWTVGSGDLYRKPVAWINAAAPGRGAGASDALADVLRYVDADVLEPGGVRLPLAPGAVGPDGEIADAGYRQDLEHAVVGLATAVRRRPAGPS